jgi:hypothetical protein
MWAAGFLPGPAPAVREMFHGSKLGISPLKESALWRLAELFPSATPLRIPILVGITKENGSPLEENTVIEFGTSRMIFFESRLPLELEDKFHLQNSDGSLETEAVVVALRVKGGSRAIVARFVAEVRNWAVQR